MACNMAVRAGSVARFRHFYFSCLAPAWGVPIASSVKSVNQRQGYAAWEKLPYFIFDVADFSESPVQRKKECFELLTDCVDSDLLFTLICR